ncbi:phage protein Gp27 family protein [Thalassobaculum sp.]|uniref:phage protein Gp27 family protein n=1 Tax=Thalassobaculum sp. TaxID=2022740 RepID=UPI0032EC55B6
MGRKKTIPLIVPDEILANLDRLIAEDRLTLDQLVAWLDTQHGIRIPRSTLGNHAKDVREALDQMNKAREVSRAFVRELGQDATDEQNRLLIEMTQAIVFKVLQPEIQGEASTMTPQDLHFIARTLKDAVQAGRHGMELRDKVRREVTTQARKDVAAVAKEKGLSAEVVDAITQRILKGA